MNQTMAHPSSPSRRRPIVKLASLAVIGFLSTSLFAQQAPPVVTGLHRVGPTGGANVGYFPEWYQDSTGLAFEFGVALTPGELAAGLVLLLTGDVASTPENYVYPALSPTTFFNEHFYWHAAAVNKAIPLDNGTNRAAKGKLIMGIEGAFMTAALEVPGSQVTFARIRIDMSEAPYSGTYTLETPYKTYVIPGIQAGQRIFFTDDYGVAMGNFADVINGPIGPFLWPADATGKELPPFAFENRLYASDGVAATRVVGSPIKDPTGTGGYRNYIKLSCDIPGAPVGTPQWSWREDTFVVTGRLKTGALPSNIALQRAARYVTPSEKRLDFLASGSLTLPTRIPGGLITQAVAVPATLTVYPAAPAITATGLAVPTGVTGVPLVNNGILPTAESYVSFFGRWTAAAGQTLPLSVTTIDDNLFVREVKVTDTVIVTTADYSLANKTLTVAAQTADIVSPTSLYLQGVDGVTKAETFSSTKTVANLNAPPAYLTVVSNGGGSATVPVSLGIPTSAPNTPPTAGAISAKAQGTTPISIDVSGYVNDVDGDPLVVTGVSQPSSGTAGFNVGTKIVTFTAATNFGGIASFTYTVSDGRGGTAQGTITVDVNRPPTAGAIAATANGTELKTIDVSAFVSDPDATDVLFISATGAVTPAGSATVGFQASSRLLTFQAAQNVGGTVSFPYTISDGRGGTANATVTVTVNRPPTAVNDTQSILVNSSAVFSVLVNDTDPDGASATLGTASLYISYVSPVTPATLGTAVPSADKKSIAFTSNNSTGTGTFTYTVTDGGGLSSNATVTVTVNPANQAPVATPQTLPAATNPAVALQAKTINLTLPATGNYDPEGSPITVFSAAGLATGSGTLAISTDKTSVIYTPSLTASQGTGQQTFNYTLTDGQLTSNPSTVTVTVNDRVTITSARAQRRSVANITTGYRWDIAGTAGPGATVSIRPGTSATGTVLTTVTADATGNWSIANFTQNTIAAQPTQVTVTSTQRGAATFPVAP